MKKVALVGGLCLFAQVVTAQSTIPVPSSWDFPNLVKSALEIAPNNMAGVPFNDGGIAYSVKELEVLPVLTMSAEALQKYADVVTHAYPDAVSQRGNELEDCSTLPIESLNQTSFANLAYISLNALDENSRGKASDCLKYLQTHLVSAGE